VLVGAAIGLRGLHSSRERLRVVSVSALLLFVIGAFMAGSMQFRAQAAPPGSQGPLAFLLGDSRAPIWRVALDMIGERPLAGLGYANPELGDLFSARFDDPLFRQVFRHAHNVVLDYALQMGVTGALVVVLLFGTLAAAFYRRARGHGLARLAGVCGVALVVGMFLRNMTDDFFSRHGVLFFAAVAGMLLGLGTRRPPLAAVTRR
jgi:O-antigen ligase